MNVMMMAAGEGTRLRPFTYTLPKPAIPFLNIPLASHSLGFLGDMQIQKLVVNTFHLPSKVHDLFQTIPHGAKELYFSDEIGEILGNGGGLGKAQDYFIGGGDFIMMNSDEVILPKRPDVLQQALLQHKKSKSLATLLVMEHPEVGHQFGGVWVDSTNKVLGFGKAGTVAAAKGWHYIGVQILSERIFQYIPKNGASNILHDVMKTAIAKGETVECFPFECTWFETGNIKDFVAAAEKCSQVLSSTHPSFEKQGLKKVIAKFSATKVLTENINQSIVHRSEDSKIHPSAKLEGFICLGQGSRILDDCSLKNVLIGNNVDVPAGTKAENTLII